MRLTVRLCAFGRSHASQLNTRVVGQTRENLRKVIETIAAPSGQFKAEIVQRPDGHLQVFLLRWVEEIVPGHGKVAEFWEDQNRVASLTDDLEIARPMARELLVANDPSFVGTLNPSSPCLPR